MFEIQVRYADGTGEPWWEKIPARHGFETIEEAEQWGRDIVREYNDTLRIGEKAREYLGVRGGPDPAEPEAEAVTISYGEYERLMDCVAKLRALEEAGVDEREGYDDAMASVEDYEEEFED